MLDPAIIHDMRQALTLPVMPPAIERAWISPATERAEQILGPWIENAEQQAQDWREAARAYEHDLDRIRSVAWTEGDLQNLDETINAGEKHARELLEWTDGIRRNAAKANRVIKRHDFSAARFHERLVARFTRMQRENVATLRKLVGHLREYRNYVDTRTGAAPGYEPKPWMPNRITTAAMRDARAGNDMRRVGSVADLMSALHAERD